MQFDLFVALKDFLSALSLCCALYSIGACMCRIRHPSTQVKHSWKLIYVVILGLSGWALCDLLGAERMLFQQATIVAVALYMHMTKRAWIIGPPVIAQAEPAARRTYADVRNVVNTGDMIGIATDTIGGRLIELGQRIAGLPYAHITHNAIAVWEGNRLMVLEMSPSGNGLKPLSQYKDKRMVVCSPPSNTNFSKFDTAFDRATEHHIPYGLIDLLRIALRLLLMRFINTSRWGGDGDADKVCSLLPAFFYARMGGDTSAIPALASPAEVVNALTLQFEIAPSRA